MNKSISPTDLRAKISDVVNEVNLRGDRYIIERRGKPVAAIVPFSVLEAFDQERQNWRRELVERMESIASRSKVSDPAVIDATIEEAIAESRRERRRGKR